MAVCTEQCPLLAKPVAANGGVRALREGVRAPHVGDIHARGHQRIYHLSSRVRPCCRQVGESFCDVGDILFYIFTPSHMWSLPLLWSGWSMWYGSCIVLQFMGECLFLFISRTLEVSQLCICFMPLKTTSILWCPSIKQTLVSVWSSGFNWHSLDSFGIFKC